MKSEFKVGDLINATYVSVLGSAIHLSSVRVERVTTEALFADGIWFLFVQCTLVSRPQKTEKKKVWVKAYEQNPAAGHEEPRYTPVQIEAEMPVKE